MIKHRRILLVTAFVVAFFMVAEPAIVSAASLSEIRNEISEKQKELEAGKAKESGQMSQILELEQLLMELDSEITEAEAKLKQLEKEVEEAQEKVDTQTTNLNSRLRNMYKTSSIGYVDVLLDSGSLSELLTNLDLVKKIYSADQKLLEELKTAHEELEQKKQEAEDLKTELEASKKEKEEDKATLEAEKAATAEANEATQREIDELQEEAWKKIAAEEASSGSDGSSYYGGIMAWPTPSTSLITSPFGYRIHPIYGYRKFHSGIDIGASYGSSIVAANAGTVTFAGYSSGYGYYIKISHGGGYTTLYAHCSSLLVSKGQTVSRGQTIAKVGSTGASTGAHLHFEVIVNGTHQNPLNYM